MTTKTYDVLSIFLSDQLHNLQYFDLDTFNVSTPLPIET